MGARIAEVGVRWEHRDGSKVRWFHYGRALLDVVRIASRVRASRGIAALLPARAKEGTVATADLESSLPIVE